MRKLRRAFTHYKQEQIRRFERWRRHPFSLPIVSFMGAVVVGAGILGILAMTHTTTVFHPDTSYIVIIKHDGVTDTVPTKEPTVGKLLKKLAIPVSSRDRVEPGLKTRIVQDNFHINIYRAVPVTIIDGSKITQTYSAAGTPRGVVADAGLPLYAEDIVTARPAVSLVAQQSLGEDIVINRATPVTLNIYGTELPLRTHDETVATLLRDRGVKLRSQDTVIPDGATPITPGLQIFVNRKGTKIVTESHSIPEPVQAVTDSSLSFGTTVVRQQGTPGTEVMTYQADTVNGKVVAQTLLQTVVTVQPVPQIIARGQAVSIPADKQAVMAQAGVAASDYKYVDYIASHEGAWCPTKIQGTHVCPGYMSPADVPAYGGYGIFQATPGRKMAVAGGDWATNAVTQIRWATTYADARYGSWAAAYNHWTVYHNW